MEKTTYKGYTIEPDDTERGGVMFYPYEHGAPDHDYDYDDGWKYCGNCKWADDVDEAKIYIDELIEVPQ